MPNKLLLFKNCQGDLSFFAEAWGYHCLGQAIICPLGLQAPLIKENVWEGMAGEWFRQGSV